MSEIAIVGSGIAGLFAAQILAKTHPVTLFTKRKLNNTNTRWAQGGIAAVWSNEDTVESHVADTLSAGHGLCDSKAVELLARESRSIIEELIQIGTNFDKDSSGEYQLGLEAAHSRSRVLHAGGDATGLEIQRALVEVAMRSENIKVRENCQVSKIVTDNNRVSGVRYFDLEEGAECFQSFNFLVLASGGAGALYQFTSNPLDAVGEGLYLAYQAGAVLADLEFFQFHPTALNIKGKPNFLISEALRGEGAVLINADGESFMDKIHPKKSLAPRDVVSRAIFSQLQNGEGVYLDITNHSKEFLEKRFPTIFQVCREAGLLIEKDLIPVAPVAHYFIGGVKTDINGETKIENLFACGEVARTGVHGANRLASNSLLEGAVFAKQCAKAIVAKSEKNNVQNHDAFEAVKFQDADHQQCAEKRNQVRASMWENAGIIRSQRSLQQNLKRLRSLSIDALINPEVFELKAMRKVGELISSSSLKREESIGAHQRKDFPEKLNNSNYIIEQKRSENEL